MGLIRCADGSHDAAMALLTNHGLTSVAVPHMHSLTDGDLRAIADASPLMEKLEISYCDSLTPEVGACVSRGFMFCCYPRTSIDCFIILWR